MFLKKLLLSVFSCTLVLNTYAQNKAIWSEIKKKEKETYFTDKYWQPKQYKQFFLDTTSLYNLLKEASNTDKKTTLSLPTAKGDFTDYSIEEASIIEPALAAKYPTIKTYRGVNINNPSEHIRISKTELGFNAYIFGKEIFYITSINSNKEQYIVYNKKDIELTGTKMTCAGGNKDINYENDFENTQKSATNYASIGTQLRTYRLAMACSKEYTNFHGGTVAKALAAIVTTVNRVVGIYERDLGISLTLVSNTDLLICTNSSSFVYSNNDGNTMLGENQSRVSNIIGNSNYDIGHVFSTGGGGVAIKAVCQNWGKAQGVTGGSSPVDDPFDIDYVAHEMGHQFGADHTFNSETGSCGSGNREANNAYEPGSGSTVLSYAGICGATNNLQEHSDAYFHTNSFDQVQDYITSTNAINNCPVKTATGNTIPVISSTATTYTIPKGAKFRLTCSATDSDGDELTYCWEEMDLGAACNWNVPTGTSPRYRSFEPSLDSSRYFPKNVITGNTIKGEVTPPANASLNFRCTVRDNSPGGGGVIYSPEITVKTVNATKVFSVTTQETNGIVYEGGSDIFVGWEVAETDLAPFNSANVDIFLSADNGVTFPYTIAKNIPNTGSGTATLPFDVGTTQARLIVQGSNNVFFDVNDKAFEITEVPSSIKETKQTAGALNVYPNPNEGVFTIELSKEIGKKASISVIDILGKEVMKKTVVIERSMLLNSSELNKGIYTLKIETNSQAFTKKIILQ